MSRPKWQYENNVSCSIYNRHPDTGSGGFQGAYVYVDTRHTEQGLIEIFSKHGWDYLRKDRHNYLVFCKQI